MGNGRDPLPPVAPRRPYSVCSPHGTRVDPYYWLRDDTRSHPEVLAYLAAENEYAEAVLTRVHDLEEAVRDELRARIADDDTSVPRLDRGSWYYVRHERGKEHPIHARRRGDWSAPEETLLDANLLARGHPFFRIGSYMVTDDGRWLAWSEDRVGRNQFVVRVKDLERGEVLADVATHTSGLIAWASDGRTLFYGGKDERTLRDDRVFRHVIGGARELAYVETDPSFQVAIAHTKSRRFITIELRSTERSEVLLLDADRPEAPPRVFLARRPGHLYRLDHVGSRFVVHTNLHAKNFRVVEVADDAPDVTAWTDVIAHSDDAVVEDVVAYTGFIAACVRKRGLRDIHVVPIDGAPFVVDAADPAYTMGLVDTPDPSSARVRYTYESPVQPRCVYEVDVADRRRTLLKQQPVPTYDADRYTCARLHATAADGSAVPISVVHRKDVRLDGTAPLLIAGYGAYGISLDPRFDANVITLLDRGWAHAIAHVRGGQELGRAWYEDGKLLRKRNTFDDFIAVTEHLVAQGVGAPDRVFAIGARAGGLLVGAVINQRPDLYRGVVMLVPFVDVVTSMLDESIPLTTNEYDEWGNPSNDRDAYEYMLGYSPYDNIAEQAYPAIYVRGGLWDSQVQYWEPAKWVAKLRATKRDESVVLFETDMNAGHAGIAGRFERLRQVARTYAFLIAESSG